MVDTLDTGLLLLIALERKGEEEEKRRGEERASSVMKGRVGDSPNQKESPSHPVTQTLRHTHDRRDGRRAAVYS